MATSTRRPARPITERSTPGERDPGPRYAPGMIGAAASFTNASVSGQPGDWAVSLGNLEWFTPTASAYRSGCASPRTATAPLIGNKNWSGGANVGWVISSMASKNINWNAAGGPRRSLALSPAFSDVVALLAVTFNRPANEVIGYWDGVPVSSSNLGSSGAASLNAGLATLVGSSGSGAYSGSADVDDLGIWTRVLGPREVSGIYAAGLRHLPLTAAVPGVPPVIIQQPASGRDPRVGRGFSVDARGGAYIPCQWRRNGVNLPGATNATLVIPAATVGRQGGVTPCGSAAARARFSAARPASPSMS